MKYIKKYGVNTIWVFIKLLSVSVVAFLLPNYLSVEDFGIFSYPILISEFWLIISIAVVISLFPVIVKMKEAKDANYYLNLKRLYILIIAISIIFATQ